MDQWEDMEGMLDGAMKDITKRMAGIDLERIETDTLPDNGKVSALITELSGPDGITLAYNVENALLWKIAQGMKRRPIEDMEEAGEYAREYFNVVCGHLISRLSRKTKTILRFTMPEYLPHCFGEKDSKNAFVLYYRSQEGSVRVQGVYNNK